MSESQNSVSRRDLLKSAGVLGAGSIMAAAAGAMADPAKEAAQPASQPGGQTVPRRPFGKTGVDVPILSLGGIFDIGRNQLMLKQSLKWGISYWDTAHGYVNGNSERGIGMFLEKEPQTRKDIFLVTKSVAEDTNQRDEEFRESLERLKTDYVDLFFVHAVRNAKSIEDHADEWKKWAEKAKAAKKIKFFGFSTHSNMAECLSAAARLGFIDGIMLKYDFRIMEQKEMKAAVDACVKAGVGLTAMKTQGGKSRRPAESTAKLAVVDQFIKKGFTDKQANVKAVWENKHIACICAQMPNLTILTSNYLAAIDKTKLSSSERRLMSEYAATTCSSYCAGCSDICEAAVAGGLPIADVMRFLMYRNDYGMGEEARELFAELSPETRRQLASADYALAEARCPQKIAIAEMMRSATELLA
jgi:uncharacterized protein